MKLLYTLTTYPPSTGGAQLHQHMLAQHLKPRHSIEVVTCWDTDRVDWLLGTTLCAPGYTRDYTIDGITVQRIGLSLREKIAIAPYVLVYYPLMSMALPPIATCLAQHLQPYRDVDLLHHVRIGREGLAYASYQVARRRDIPFVLTPVHHPRWVGWRYREYIKLYGLADAVLVLTNAEKKTLVALGVPEERITITGIGPILSPQADAISFQEHYRIDGPIVLFLGQHYDYKGYRQLLQAAPIVWQRVPEVHFVFVGPAVGQSERAFAIAHDPRIHRLGRLDLQGKTNALAACTLLCVPSLQESFGGVYTEAWSFGKPVIGCPIPAVAEVITDHVDGYLVEQEPAQIAERICDLLLNSRCAEEMGAAGRRKVERSYTWKRLSDLTERVYQNVLGSID
jgi:glycosyltransferase involved in cell wall biosynthesis